MNKIKTGVVLVLVIIGVYTWYSYITEGKITYESIKTEIVEKEVLKEVNPLDEQIKQREKELEEKYSKIKSLEAEIDVLKAEDQRITARIKELQSELSTFMTGTR